MKKIITLSFICIVAMHGLYAQNAAKATAVGSRLVGQSLFTYYNGPADDIDSTVYIYTGTRGGDLTHMPLKYDSLINMNPNNGSPVINYINTQNFDANNNILSNTHFEDIGYGVVIYDRDTFTYDNNNNQVSDWYQTWDTTTHTWSNSDSRRYYYTYDANHNMLTTVDSDWNGSAFVFHYYTHNAYNGDNKISNKVQLIDGTYYSDIYVYDASGNMIADTAKDGSSLNTVAITYLTLYTYDGNNNKIADTSYNTYLTGTLKVQARHLDSGFVAHQPQIEVYQGFSNNTWTNSYKDYYTYNNDNQLISVDYEQPDNDGNFPGQPNNSVEHYYYDDYTLSVDNFSDIGGRASIYPVPTQTQLHIDLTWDAPQACSIIICDMQGRIAKQWQIPTTAAYHTTVLVNDLAEGTYFINITGTDGKIVKKLVVSK